MGGGPEPEGLSAPGIGGAPFDRGSGGGFSSPPGGRGTMNLAFGFSSRSSSSLGSAFLLTAGLGAVGIGGRGALGSGGGFFVAVEELVEGAGEAEGEGAGGGSLRSAVGGDLVLLPEWLECLVGIGGGSLRFGNGGASFRGGREGAPVPADVRRCGSGGRAGKLGALGSVDSFSSASASGSVNAGGLEPTGGHRFDGFSVEAGGACTGGLKGGLEVTGSSGSSAGSGDAGGC